MFTGIIQILHFIAPESDVSHIREKWIKKNLHILLIYVVYSVFFKRRYFVSLEYKFKSTVKSFFSFYLILNSMVYVYIL